MRFTLIQLVAFLLVAQPAWADSCHDVYGRLAQPEGVRVHDRLPVSPHDFRYMQLSPEDLAEMSLRYVEDLRGEQFPAEARAKLLTALAEKSDFTTAFRQAGIEDETLASRMGAAVREQMEGYQRVAKPISPSASEAAALKAHADASLATAIAQHNIPHYQASLPDGRQVPVVLVNRDTFPQLKELFYNELPYAQGTKQFPNDHGGTDHGVIRMLGHNIDWYFPGELGFSETHNSGLGWRELGALLQHSKGGNPIVEVAYSLSPEEKRAVELYHRVRRGNLFQVRNKWTPDRPIYDSHTAVLNRGSENCYMFGSGICTIEHSRNMTDYLTRMGVKNVDEFLEKPESLAFLRVAEEQIMRAPIYDPKYINDAKAQEAILHDWMLGQNPKYKKIFGSAMPAEIKTQEDEVRFLNYLLGIDVSRRYAAVMKDLGQLDFGAALTNVDQRGVHDRSLWPHLNADRPRASAVFIYDTSPVAAEGFGSRPYPGAWIDVPAGGLPQRKF